MKKYLMTGFAALVMCFGFTSCSHDDITPLTQEELTTIEVENIVRNYEGAFQKVFGQPVNNHTWGFGENVTRTAAPNANLWGAEWNVPLVLTTSQKNAVRLYFQYNNKPQGISIDYQNFFVQDVYKGATTPLNNGTDEFAAYSTETYLFGGELEAGSNHMDYLTAGSDNDHIANYNDATCSTNENVTYAGVYVTGYTPQTAYDDPNWEVNNRNNLAQHSDEIQLMTNSKTDCFGWHETQGEIHHNDKFVIIDGTTIQTWATNNGIDIDVPLTGRQFVGFDYEAKINISDFYVYEYVDLGNGQWGPSTNPKMYDENTPYISSNAYDNQASVTVVPAGTPGAYPVNERYVDGNQANGNVWVKLGCADGFYSDWIVCITEGIRLNITSPDLRVMAEDLSAGERGEDFDFNDVVFDVYFSPNQGEAYVMVQAAGGTLPLKINGTEVHGLFNQPTDKMINTHAEDLGLNGVSGLPAQRITLTGVIVNSKSDANTKIHIVVTKPVKVNGETIQKDIELVNSNAAACKIGVNPSITWANERQNVNNVCNFNLWVTEGGELEPTK